VVLIFFQPVYLHFQLADLLVETSYEGFFAFFPLACLWGEHLRQAIKGLFFPLGNLCGVNPILCGDLIGCFLPFDGLQGDPRLQVATVSFPLD
jgi:hypothetical protein